MSWHDLVVISPLVAGVLTAAAILIIDIIRPGSSRLAVGTSLVGLAVTAGLTLSVSGPAFDGAYRADALTTFLDILFIAVIAMTIVFGPDYLLPRGLPVAEYTKD